MSFLRKSIEKNNLFEYKGELSGLGAVSDGDGDDGGGDDDDDHGDAADHGDLSNLLVLLRTT